MIMNLLKSVADDSKVWKNLKILVEWTIIVMIWKSDTSVTAFILDDLLDGYHESMRLERCVTFKNYDIHFYINQLL